MFAAFGGKTFFWNRISDEQMPRMIRTYDNVGFDLGKSLLENTIWRISGNRKLRVVGFWNGQYIPVKTYWFKDGAAVKGIDKLLWKRSGWVLLQKDQRAL